MPCQILVSNKSNLPKAEIITVVEGVHSWTKNESMQAFISEGGVFDDWPRQFSIVKVLDKTKEELLYLQGFNDSGERAFYFIEPEQNSPEWQDLYLTGETSGNWEKVSSFIGER